MTNHIDQETMSPYDVDINPDNQHIILPIPSSSKAFFTANFFISEEKV
jgi:hypothetical protein